MSTVSIRLNEIFLSMDVGIPEFVGLHKKSAKKNTATRLSFIEKKTAKRRKETNFY